MWWSFRRSPRTSSSPGSDPSTRALFARLGGFAQVLHFDKRGTGASDRTARLPTVDQRVEDLVAVMDAAGCERAHLLGLSEGGPVAIALAATYPQRVETLALFGSGAASSATRRRRARRAARRRPLLPHRWGAEESVTLDVFGPSVAGDASYRAWEPRYERQSATPAALGELLEMVEAIDVRPLLSSVSAPTLILHRRDDHVVSVARARETAALLPHARLVELDGVDHLAQAGDVDEWIDHYERFVVGALRPVRRAPSRPRRADHDAGRVPCQRRRRGGAGKRLGLPPGPDRCASGSRRRSTGPSPRRARRAALA